MKLTLQGLQDRQAFTCSGIELPHYDVVKVKEESYAGPRWVHFGIGNIFRFFIGGIADELLEKELMSTGIVCLETFDEEVVDKIYRPFDNLVLAVTLFGDGTTKEKVLAPLTEAHKAGPMFAEDWDRVKEIFKAPSLQMVSFTITEKGYALKASDGSFTRAAQSDFAKGPAGVVTAMGILTSLLWERYQEGKTPLALVSMDNVSKNGKKLREAVLEMANAWVKNGLVQASFVDWVSDEKTVSFPWTMIDKITPRPSDSVKQHLTELGVEQMDIVVTDKKTYIAPFANAEAPQYLVIEDSFPNGRPPLEKAGVYMTDRETVNLSERMKVTACLNPIHTALCTYDCMLGYELFADGMKDPQIHALGETVGYKEGLPMVKDPGILSPEAFLREVMEVRFPNPYLGDTSQRIAVDISQMVGIRFGETIKAHVEKYGTAEHLIGLPLAIAGWIRYLMAIDDKGEPFSLAPDPMIPELQEAIKTIRFGEPESLKDQLRPILSNDHIFSMDLYAAGIGEKIEQLVKEEIKGPGAVRETLIKMLG